jgi:hypothetical protein
MVFCSGANKDALQAKAQEQKTMLAQQLMDAVNNDVLLTNYTHLAEGI